jgi:hypothetical protein
LPARNVQHAGRIEHFNSAVPDRERPLLVCDGSVERVRSRQRRVSENVRGGAFDLSLRTLPSPELRSSRTGWDRAVAWLKLAACASPACSLPPRRCNDSLGCAQGRTKFTLNYKHQGTLPGNRPACRCRSIVYSNFWPPAGSARDHAPAAQISSVLRPWWVWCVYGDSCPDRMIRKDAPVQLHMFPTDRLVAKKRRCLILSN